MPKKRTLCSTRANYDGCPYCHFSTGYGGLYFCNLTRTDVSPAMRKKYHCVYGSSYIRCSKYRKHPYGYDCKNAT